eukprot:CAMPEP_0201284416 /NCGR_PEP_ID=MMETSP1317-20130820/73296_1 /ASSEMBLY_ACC=CAM_ASM_000770 /TAXON_ID=187299 /ORGANISM="Undescribed Undescribed, Strain Undescribed" /LENGTH=231 /DNA_ID=CAMNT_0047604465 /DNA_START=25 /DNA_END=721 /DNA_ORIENTATION=+
MSEKDYYKILGINKDASDSEIKKAYRKLAMKYHPDHTKGDKNAEEKFKNISEAYAVLSDKGKRKQYDEFGSADFHQRFSQEDIFQGFDLGNILKEFGFGGMGRQGSMRFSFGGSPPFSSHTRQQPQQVKGSDLIYEIPLTLQEIMTGTTKKISLQHQDKTEIISVKIPKGMIAGKKIRVVGKGSPSSHYGGQAGDFYILSKAEDNPDYIINDYDITLNHEIKLTESQLAQV